LKNIYVIWITMQFSVLPVVCPCKLRISASSATCSSLSHTSCLCLASTVRGKWRKIQLIVSIETIGQSKYSQLFYMVTSYVSNVKKVSNILTEVIITQSEIQGTLGLLSSWITKIIGSTSIVLVVMIGSCLRQF